MSKKKKEHPFEPWPDLTTPLILATIIGFFLLLSWICTPTL